MGGSQSAFQKQRCEYIQKLIEQERESLTDNTVDNDFTEQQTEDCEDLSGINPDYYPFENLIFEGGGMKGLAYYGVIKVLEKTKILKKIKRFAGTSFGAITATLLAVGYGFDDLIELMDMDFEKLMKDGSFFFYLYNLFSYFGLHPGDKFEKWIGNKLKEKTGSADITFAELSCLRGIELCVVVANVNWMRADYCHLKTTPDMPIRLAVRMSVSIPGMFMAKRYEQYCGRDVFVDGGIVSGYPLHCFDGWFLSLAKQDNFIERLLVHDEDQSTYLSRFKPEGVEVNTKSLGFILYGENDLDMMQQFLPKRVAEPKAPEVKTKLYRKRLEDMKYTKKAEKTHERLRKATKSFLKALEKCNLHDGPITKEELRRILDEACNLDVDEGTFSKSDVDVLFMEKAHDIDTLFDWLDRDKTGKIDQTELITFIGGLGIPLHENTTGYKRRDVKGICGFLDRLQSTMLRQSVLVHVKPTDAVRTVGINIGYIRFDDFVLEDGDKKFLLKRGFIACKKFLQNYARTE